MAQVQRFAAHFSGYASYHMARKPTSVVKNVLNQNCTNLVPDEGVNITGIENTWCSWSPFDGDNADVLLGSLDSAFLFSYAFGMYLMGSLGERINVRYFLSIGMMFSGIFSFLFGMAYWTNIHSLAYFIIVQVLAGLFQSTGWPGCVAAVGNWFGKSKRGLIMGIWRSHHSIGNIAGSLIAGAFVEYSWGLSFAVPAVIIFSLGLLTFTFLVPDPRAVGCPVPVHNIDESTPSEQEIIATEDGNKKKDDDSDSNSIKKESLSSLSSESSTNSDSISSNKEDEKAISFWRAVQIPGVMEYSFSLFFTKLINYTFLYWLPKYLKDSSDTLGSQDAANLSILFDIGGIFGGILAGLLSDLTGMSAFTCAGYFILTIPSLFVYREYGGVSAGLNIFPLVSGGFSWLTDRTLSSLRPCRLIWAHIPSLKAPLVTAIIDGTGSIGAAVGPLIAGALSDLENGWDYLFYALMVASALGLLLLTRLMINEAKAKCKKKNNDD
uniref:Sugar phosphate exchanger 3 n=1 Tax=Daphnia galeata TaxID=27404 RepID=A0A8J2RTC4_9CRUS|nr:unnamed protein product [Daphnia galeata]